MTPEPRVTVVIPCFNGARTIGLQLESLARQDDSSPPFEVIVADNGSTDDLTDVIRPFQLGNLLDIRVVDASRVAGTSFARNVGVRCARAETILFCDSDDVVGSRFVEFGASTLEHVPLFSGAAIAVESAVFPTSVDEAWQSLDEPLDWSPPLPGRRWEGIPVLMGAVFGIRRSTFIDLGGFDQSLPSSGEDNDFDFRALASGVPIAESECVQILYRSTSDHRRRMIKVGNESRARALLVRRYGIDPEDVFPGWRIAPLRAVAAAVKSFAGKRDPEVNRAIRERWVASSRFVWAMAEYSRSRRRPQSLTGLGLSSNE